MKCLIRALLFSFQIVIFTAVRYAWANNPQEANLYNEENLPASPFRTDNWWEFFDLYEVNDGDLKPAVWSKVLLFFYPKILLKPQN